MEVEDAGQLLSQIPAESSGGGRIRDLQNGQIVGGRHHNLLVEVEGNESGVDTFHGGKEIGGESGVVEGKNLISDGNASDLSSGQVALNVCLDPGQGLLGVPHSGQVLVAQADDELHAGVGEGLEDSRIGVVKLDAGDADGFDEWDDGLRVGKVIGDLSVVDAEGERRREE